MRIATFYVCFCVAFACVASPQGRGRPSQPSATRPVPRTIDGKPDLSGVWLKPRVIDPGTPEMLPWAAELTAQRAADKFKDMPSARCLPMGVSLIGPEFTKLIQTPAVLVAIQESPVGGTIQVFLDGRDHPKDLQSTWRGHSVGRWDADTLVVDTLGFNDLSWLDGRGRPRTKKLHVTQRIRRVDFDHLEIETAIEDSGAFVRPWTTRTVSDLAPGEEVQEVICNENNQYAK